MRSKVLAWLLGIIFFAPVCASAVTITIPNNSFAGNSFAGWSKTDGIVTPGYGPTCPGYANSSTVATPAQDGDGGSWQTPSNALGCFGTLTTPVFTIPVALSRLTITFFFETPGFSGCSGGSYQWYAFGGTSTGEGQPVLSEQMAPFSGFGGNIGYSGQNPIVASWTLGDITFIGAIPPGTYTFTMPFHNACRDVVGNYQAGAPNLYFDNFGGVGVSGGPSSFLGVW